MLFIMQKDKLNPFHLLYLRGVNTFFSYLVTVCRFSHPKAAKSGSSSACFWLRSLLPWWLHWRGLSPTVPGKTADSETQISFSSYLKNLAFFRRSVADKYSTGGFQSWLFDMDFSFPVATVFILIKNEIKNDFVLFYL